MPDIVDIHMIFPVPHRWMMDHLGLLFDLFCVALIFAQVSIISYFSVLKSIALFWSSTKVVVVVYITMFTELQCRNYWTDEYLFQILCRAIGGKTGRAKAWDLGVTCVHPSPSTIRLLSSLNIPPHLPVIECHRDEVTWYFSNYLIRINIFWVM